MNPNDAVATEIILLEAERQLDLQKKRIARLQQVGLVLLSMCSDCENIDLMDEIRRELDEEGCF